MIEEGRNPDENRDDENSGWGRGSGLEEARKMQRMNDERDNARRGEREAQGKEGGFSRGDFTRRTGPSPTREDGPRPEERQQDGPGFGFRNSNAARSTQQRSEGGPPRFQNSGKNREAREGGEEGNFGFRGNPGAKQAGPREGEEERQGAGARQGGPPQSMFHRSGGTGTRGGAGTRGGS